MPNLLKNNEKAIEQGFKEFRGGIDSIYEKAMRELLHDAMVYALAAHDGSPHFGHVVTADSYGWLLLHDGKAVAWETNSGRHGEGHAYTELMSVSREAPQSGWVGILLASMEAEMERIRNVWFVVGYEQDILNNTRGNIEDSFGKYFKPVLR